jgi:DNA-binding transcriptional MerR regulator
VAVGPATLSISEVSRRTGIPISTLRFYERELSGLFHIRKTAGGHRRYSEADVERFATVRRLSETEGLGLSEVRRAVRSRGDEEALREELERFAAAQSDLAAALEALARRVASIEERLAGVEASPRRKRRWLGGD